MNTVNFSYTNFHLWSIQPKVMCLVGGENIKVTPKRDLIDKECSLFGWG